MRKESALRIERARAEQPFSSVQDLASRAALDRHDLAVLAEAATLRGLAGHRHRARWEIAAVEKPRDDLLRRSEFYSRPGNHEDPNSQPSPNRGHGPLLQQAEETMITIRPPSEVG